jgi:hypothetical protein
MRAKSAVSSPLLAHSPSFACPAGGLAGWGGAVLHMQCHTGPLWATITAACTDHAQGTLLQTCDCVHIFFLTTKLMKCKYGRHKLTAEAHTKPDLHVPRKLLVADEVWVRPLIIQKLQVCLFLGREGRIRRLLPLAPARNHKCAARLQHTHLKSGNRAKAGQVPQECNRQGSATCTQVA